MWLVKAWPADKGLSVQLTLTLRLAFYVIFYDVLLKLFSSTASPFDFGIMCFPTAPKRPIRYSLGFISFQSTTCILVTNACGWLYYDEFNKCTLILRVYIYIYSMDWNGLSRGKPTGNQSLSLVFILAKMLVSCENSLSQFSEWTQRKFPKRVAGAYNLPFFGHMSQL